MIHKIVIILFFSVNVLSSIALFAQQEQLIEIRNLLRNAYEEDSFQDVIIRIENLKLQAPVFNAYKGVAIMLKAKNCFSPFEKLKYFREGKAILENSICSDKSCVEIRYLRFCVQTNAPFFLGYSDNIEVDKDFILQNWKSLNDLDLKERIKNRMLNSDFCTEAEKKIFAHG